MKLLIPALMIAGVLVGGSTQAAESFQDVLNRATRAQQEQMGVDEDARLRRAQRRLIESQLDREDTQQMRDEVIIMDTMNRQLQHGIAPIAPLPGLPRPGLGY